MRTLHVDPKRKAEFGDIGTGVYVRAMDDGKWASVDIIWLTRGSLHDWLRSRGGANLWAENFTMAQMGHEPLTEEEAATASRTEVPQP